MRCTALKNIVPLALLAIGIVARPAVVEATTLVVDFEDLAVPAEGHFEGTDDVPYDWTHTDNPWVSNGVTFHNWWSVEHYEYQGTWYDYTAWHSFSYSNKTWTGVPPASTEGEYVAYPNSGAGGSANYGVCFRSSEEVTETGPGVYDATSYLTFDLPDNHQIQSMYVANNTFAWDSMKNGDSFAKKFGGATGNDEDWFRLRITGLDAGGDPISAEPLDVYLADYRFGDPADDYILEDWQFVDLIALDEAAKLQFSLKSTDVGQYGMNTPGFFLIDNLSLKQLPELSWNATGGGFWSDATKWSSASVPGGTDTSVVFGSAITDASTVVTDAAVTVKNVFFENPFRYVIAGAGSLTLQDGAATDPLSYIKVVGTHEFQLPVTLGNDAEVEVQQVGDELIFNNALNLGGFTLTKVGDGLMSVNNDLTTSGGEIVVLEGSIGGSGTVGGNLTIGAAGTVAPGNSVGTIEVLDDVAFADASALHIELLGADSSDLLAVDGNLDLTSTSDTLRLEWIPVPGDLSSMFGGTYTIASYETALGGEEFDLLDLLDIGNPYFDEIEYDVDQGDGTFGIEVTLHDLLLGDINVDGYVNNDDLSVMGDPANWDQSGKTWFAGDLNLDGMVNLADLTILGNPANWNNQLAGLPTVPQLPFDPTFTVPEPSTVTLLTMALLGLLAVGWRRKSTDWC